MKNFETNEEFIYTLIIDDLDQTITPENKQLLEEWRNNDQANENTYQEFLNVQQGMDKLYARDTSDVQLSWEALDHKLNDQTGSSHSGRHIINIGLWYKIAAAVLIVLSVGSYFVLESRYMVINTEDKLAGKHITLPDGTGVDLNTATVIKYHKDFKNNRTLELVKGEIFIDVVKHEGQQFVLNLGEIEARDIGTRFNVIRNAKKINVVVEDGKVALKHTSLNMEVLLTRGKSGNYNFDTGKLVAEENLDQNFKSWIDKKFIFEDMPIARVADELGKVYQTPVLIAGTSLKNRKLTARLHYQTLDSALKVISASLQCKVTREKDTYVLSDN